MPYRRTDAAGNVRVVHSQLCGELRLPRRPGGVYVEVHVGAGGLLRFFRAAHVQPSVREPAVHPGVPAALRGAGADQRELAEDAQRLLPMEEGPRTRLVRPQSGGVLRYGAAAGRRETVL